MMHSTLSAAAAPQGARALYNRAAGILTTLIGHDLLALAARFGIAAVFWLSGRTKVEGWLNVSDSAVALFADEYQLPLLLADHSARIWRRMPSMPSRSCWCWACSRVPRHSRCSA